MYLHAYLCFFMAKEVQGGHIFLILFKTSEASSAKLTSSRHIQNIHVTNHTYCRVFSQLAEWGEGFLVSFSDLLSKIIQLCCHLIAFCGLLLWRFLLLFVSIISDSYRKSTSHDYSDHPHVGFATLNTAKCFYFKHKLSGDRNIICTDNTNASLIT